jgi:hypothetical protein
LPDHGLAGLEDRPRRGKKPIYAVATDKRILAFLDRPPPQGYARWSGPLLARALEDVDVQYVWRFLREHKIDLAARKSWCESNDPEFTAKAADAVGLYIDPPAKAIVLCVDEKPSIQALERAQGYLKLPNGRALSGQSHDYKRHGTTTLFAALEVATGKIIAAHCKRRRPVEFLGFMKRVVAAFADRELHVIVDNLNTHKKNERWLKSTIVLVRHCRCRSTHRFGAFLALLRARSERPRCRCAAEQRDEISALHSITSSARDSGIVSPRALAVFKFIARSKLTGCSTGRSLARAPLSSLST